MVDSLSPSLQDPGIKAARQRGASHIVRCVYFGALTVPGLQVCHLGGRQQGDAQRAERAD